MQGFHVEEPALHLLDIFGLVGHDHSHALFSSSFKQEGLLSLHDFAAKLQPPPISSSPQYSISKQANHRRPDFPYVGSSCPPAEINNRGMNALGNMLVPSAEKKQTLIDEYACRGMPHMGGTTEGNGVSDVGNASISTTTEASKGAAYVGSKNGYSNKQGGEHIYREQASISAPLTSAKDDHMLRFSSFEGSDADRVQDSIAAFLNGSGQPGRFGEHMGNEGIYMNNLHASMAALTCDSPSRDDPLWRFLPSNNQKHNMDFVSSDDFCMYEFKVRRCMRGRSHDWTECPFAHPGEKARRRDPRCFNYSGTACPDFRRGTCRKGDLCEFSHGVFECWLHPARYRTQLCKDGKACKRRVCFFAHSASQLRIVSPDKSGQFSLKMPFTSSTDDISCYFDAPHKQPTLITRQASSVGHGRVNGYGADRFLDDFSPKSMHRFSRDGVQDEVTIMSEHRHSLNHNEKAPHDRDLETCSVKCSYVHHGGSFKDLQKRPELNSPQDHRHHYFPVLIGDDCQYESSTGNSYCSTDSTPPSPLDSSSWKSDANFKSHFALSNLKGSLDQIMSPTSTLVSNIFSPPPLSPPLSPSKSPPMSPGMALPPWGTVSRKKVSRAAYPLPYDAFTHFPTPGMDVTHASILANLPNSNYGPSAHACTHGPSPLSATTKGNRRHDHLDGLHAMQSTMGIQDDGVQTPSIEENAPMHAMVHLISTLQEMELRHVAASVDIKSKKRSLLQRMESPKSRLEAGHAEGWAPYDLGAVQGPESEQGFRGKTIGNYAKEDVENPDFGWVNELVK